MNDKGFSRNLSPVGAWAFSIGTSIGWGSLVVTSNTYLAKAGPCGSVLGLLIGTAVMLIVGRNYAYMINAFPEAGGAYTYARELFGHDQGFLVSWFLSLTYLAMLWANVTSIPLFARYFLGDIFSFGRLYTIFGYDVYTGGILISCAAILVFAFLCMRMKDLSSSLMICMAFIFTAGIIICSFSALHGSTVSMDPAFLPEGSAVWQTIGIACISPWAFIGFENISHGAEEMTFKRTGIFHVLVISILTAGLLYICVILMSVSAYPPEYSSWLEYIRDLDNLEGIKALPAFYAADACMGRTGITILMISLLCLVFTSLIGNITALSRMFYSLGSDGILPKRFGRLDDHGVPADAVRLIAAISLLIPFLGRTAIGWIVDVTTLGATIVYGIVSCCTLKLASERGDRIERNAGLAGLLFMIGFGAYLLLPNLAATGSIGSESLFLFVVWAVLGFIYFRRLLKEDKKNQFGQSIVVWIALLSLVLFVSLVWMSQSIIEATNKGMTNIEAYYSAAGIAVDQTDMISQQMLLVRQTSARGIIVVIFIFALSLGILINNYSLMSRRARASEAQLDLVRDKANRDPLTGVKSKHAYADKEAEINAAITSGEAGEFSVVVCDVNGLKLVNDTYGHKAGDEYIRDASQMICRIFEHSPVFRTGGDEFAVILTGGDYEKREQLLEELLDLSREHIERGLTVVSAGMSDYSEGDAKLHDVFGRADAKMYEEKIRLKKLGAPSGRS